MNLWLILRLVWRDWRAGELGLLLAAIVIAVGTVSAITLFVGRVGEAMEREAATYLAADRVVSGRSPIPEGFLQTGRELGLEVSETTIFPSMVLPLDNPDRTTMVSVKAIEANYPLRGSVRIADRPFGKPFATPSVPELGTVWVGSRLFSVLGISKGDRVKIGHSSFRVSEVLVADPSRERSFMDLGPRILMRMEDLPATRVVQPGSRIAYRMLVAGEERALGSLYQRIQPQLRPNFRWRDARSDVDIGRALELGERFFLLGGSLSVLLACVAVALGSHRYAVRHYDHVGILKTLGATRSAIQWGYVGVLCVIGACGVVIGLVLGVLVHFGFIAAVKVYLPANLPLPNTRPLLVGSVTGFICLLAFALPPIIALRNVSPMAVIRRDLKAVELSSSATYLVAVAGGFGLLLWYTKDLQLTFWTVAGVMLVLTVFSIVALALLSVGRVLGMHAGSMWRLALAGLRRRYKENVPQVTVFAFAIMLLQILLLVRTALIQEWHAQMPEDTPNFFLMNVKDEEIDAVSRFIRDNGKLADQLYPLISGRVAAVNGVPANEYADSLPTHLPGPRLTSTRQLTWMDELPERNHVMDGKWWSLDNSEALVSVESGYSQQWHLKVGDELTFDVDGIPIDVRIANIRDLEESEIRPWFFFILSPAAMKEMSPLYMGAFYLPPEKKSSIADLISQHPTVVVIQVDEILYFIQQVITRVTQAIEWVMALVFAAGLLVLIASVRSSHDRRMREHALLRTLGGSKRLIAGSLVLEFVVLGFLAGLVGAAGAELSVLLLQTKVFHMDYSPTWWTWIAGPAFGTILIGGVGYLSTRKLIYQPPVLILREL